MLALRLALLGLAPALCAPSDFEVVGGVPTLALNASQPGTRAYFPATLAWAGPRLLLGVNTVSDDLHVRRSPHRCPPSPPHHRHSSSTPKPCPPKRRAHPQHRGRRPTLLAPPH